MKRSTTHVIATSALCAVCSLSTPAPAQESSIHIRYGNESSVKALIHGVERESNAFRQEYERHYAKRFIPDWRVADGERKRIQDLDKALEVAERRVEYREKPRYLRDDIAKVVRRA